jgi:DNA-binding NarL/FixJ family response regulator
MKEPRIMIVDDSPFSITLIEKILTNNGYEVVAKATNKDDMVKKFSEEKPDFVTMDLTMPEINGFESIKLLRTIDSNFKSIMISSLKDEELFEESKKLKINAYLQKPVKEDELVNTIKNIIIYDQNYYELLEEHQDIFKESFADAVNSMTRPESLSEKRWRTKLNFPWDLQLL